MQVEQPVEQAGCKGNLNTGANVADDEIPAVAGGLAG